MTKLDDFFRVPVDTLEHPTLHKWKARLGQPVVKATLELSQPVAEFGLSQAEMQVQFHQNGEPGAVETLPWDDELNSGPITFGVRAISQDQEADRFALGSRAAMRKVEREFGDGYLNSVLLQLMKDSDLTKHREINAILKHAHAISPYREGKSNQKYENCREMITGAISGRARELTANLKYTEDEAKKILVAALARYLDKRFTVSGRRRLGML
ncbi:MAG: hypothetical protein ACP5XB_16080 [Isosphaeraceae bacterium]